MSEKAYQWDANTYARHSSAQYEWARELIDKLHLRGHESVLDIGCGDGKVTALLAERVPNGRVTGIDRSENMVAFARQSFPPESYANLTFEQMDAGRITFENQFDVIFSNATLHWIKDHRAVLGGVQRSLKPGGRILFQMGGRDNAREIVAAIDRLRALPAWKTYFHDFAFPYGFYGPEEYAGWLADAGLRERRAELVFKDMKHQGADGLAGWLRTTWLPYIERVPQELRERFIAEIVATYLQAHPLDEQGLTHVDMIRLEVEADKPGW